MAINLHRHSSKSKPCSTKSNTKQQPSSSNKPTSIRYSDVANANFDELFKPVKHPIRHSMDTYTLPISNSHSNRPSYTLDSKHARLSRYTGHDETIYSENETWPSSSSVSDYSSPSASPMLNRHILTTELPERRKSLDFSKLELVGDPFNQQPKLMRKKSVSLGDDRFQTSDRNDNIEFRSDAYNSAHAPQESVWSDDEEPNRECFSDIDDDSNISPCQSPTATALMSNLKCKLEQILTIYWCTYYLLVYLLSIGVLTIYWCIYYQLVYLLSIGVLTIY